MAIYRQRNSRKTPVYQIFTKTYNEFKAVYDKKYKPKYGFFRWEIDKEAEKLLRCGIPEFGFARVRCQNKDCAETFYLPFSCKSRSLCSSCMTKHMLLFEDRIVNEVVENVPHRHMVFCLPKAFRNGFIKNREKLNDLSRLVWLTIKEFMQTTLKQDGVPGSIQVIQTHGNYLNNHPHLHVITTDGIFSESGTFHQLPEIDWKGKNYIKSLFEKNVMRFCLKEGMVKEDTVLTILQWKYTGFSVYTDSKMDLGVLAEGVDKDENTEEVQKIQQMLRYVSKPFFSQEKIVLEEGADRVLYKGDWHHGIKRNFEYYSFTDFIAAVTAHVPNHRQKYINYYGAYSNKTRGLRKKEEAGKTQDIEVKEATQEQATYSKTWAMLIQKIWEVDPLICTKCGSKMKVIAVIDDLQVTRKILEHIGEWQGLPEWEPTLARGSPPQTDPDLDGGISYENFDDGWGTNPMSA